MNTKAYPEPILWRKSPLLHHATGCSSDNTLMVRRQPIPAAVETTLEFGRFRVLLRQRQLLGDGRPIATGAAVVDPGNDKQLVLLLPPLTPGRYRVHWHVVSVDTHRTEGEYSFTVEP